MVALKNWPAVKPEHFLKKRLWQARFFDHVIRNDADLEENIDYIALNPVRAGYVSQPQFYPYTGFLPQLYRRRSYQQVPGQPRAWGGVGRVV